MLEWTARNIPDQTGKVALVTGGNSGLGFETTLALAGAGATVVIASRNLGKALAALDAIRFKLPQAKIGFIRLDLANLASIRACAEQFKADYNRLDLLFNNAGISTGTRQETKDGFEMHFGVNHLGHFALTGLLLDRLLMTQSSRIITTTSLLQAVGRLNFQDLQSKRAYFGLLAYGQSKLANILFATELELRLKAAGATTLSVAAHPGYSNTQMTRTGGSTFGTFLEDLFLKFSAEVIAQSAAMGALPQLYAATAPGVKGGGLYGPLFYTHGYPALNFRALQAYDGAASKRLWEVSENLTGVHYAISPLDALAQPSQLNGFVRQELSHLFSKN
ncbi:MAG: SDR family NAD(P)-dependent oxidoreductase [Chloroflexi bacterium]|nr:SDR family NAD(P)-dependent oxidoreductase [Chloroflexota bacterium]OJW01862.1 MAG: hypothetical protein BGO39_28330 [Chloroflexi bacterium 54-19]